MSEEAEERRGRAMGLVGSGSDWTSASLCHSIKALLIESWCFVQ